MRHELPPRVTHQTFMEQMSDSEAIKLAERIANLKQHGVDTRQEEHLLDKEISRMMNITRVYLGKPANYYE